MAKLPTVYQDFSRKYKTVWEAYDKLGAASHGAGPLSMKARELIKLAMAMGARMEGAVHSHTRRALEAGATPDEIRHAVLLGVTTLGFPATMALLTWVEDILRSGKPPKRRRR